MKIKDLNKHCGECSISEYCGNPFGFCLCTDERFDSMEESEYIKIAETATDIKESESCEGCKRPDCEAYRYSDNEYADEDYEYNDDARDYYCKQIADYVENAMKGAVKDE